MSFKKYTEMELALLASIANISEEQMEGIEMEKGDIDLDTMEDYSFVPAYLSKPNTIRRSTRRKATFKKKENRKEMARQVGYDLSNENSKKVADLLSYNHSDKSYFRGDKAERKNWTVREEVRLMEQEEEEEYYENVELARENMIHRHDSILGSIGLDILDLEMDLRINDNHISNVEKELEELRAAMEEATQKLQSAILQKNGIKAAIRKKEEDYKRLDEELTAERISRFGW